MSTHLTAPPSPPAPPAAPSAASPLPATVPGRSEAAALGREYGIVPVSQELLADTLSPPAAFALLCGADEPGFLLESVPVSGGVSRWSYVGHRPTPLAEADGDPLTALAARLSASEAPVAGLPPFHGGVLGYLGYESVRHFERLPAAAGAAPDLPEHIFFAVDDLVVFDHATRRVRLVTLHRPAEEPYDAALARLELLRHRLATPRPWPAGGELLAFLPEPPLPEHGAGDGTGAGADGAGDRPEWTANLTRAQFEERVLRARDYIAAGDAFQVVLSQRFSKPLRASARDLYRQLRATNPSPYMYHLSLGGGRHVIGASPEVLVRSEDGRVLTRPLAGTRPRGADPEADAALERELLADEKERAEHVMLVDLGRNDLGRVTEPGSVRVDRLMQVERYSHVMHLSSTVSGRLAAGRTALDALRSAFPAGTLSGAPKIRAMEIVAELEPERRGVYGGALGFAGHDGHLDFAIALRTIVVADGRVHVQAGAGVVADSDPAAEYRETLHKSRAMIAAVRRAEAASAGAAS